MKIKQKHGERKEKDSVLSEDAEPDQTITESLEIGGERATAENKARTPSRGGQNMGGTSASGRCPQRREAGEARKNKDPCPVVTAIKRREKKKRIEQCVVRNISVIYGIAARACKRIKVMADRKRERERQTLRSQVPFKTKMEMFIKRRSMGGDGKGRSRACRKRVVTSR